MKSFLNRDLRNRNSFRGGNKNKPKNLYLQSISLHHFCCKNESKAQWCNLNFTSQLIEHPDTREIFVATALWECVAIVILKRMDTLSTVCVWKCSLPSQRDHKLCHEP